MLFTKINIFEVCTVEKSIWKLASREVFAQGEILSICKVYESHAVGAEADMVKVEILIYSCIVITVVVVVLVRSSKNLSSQQHRFVKCIEVTCAPLLVNLDTCYKFSKQTKHFKLFIKPTACQKTSIWV